MQGEALLLHTAYHSHSIHELTSLAAAQIDYSLSSIHATSINLGTSAVDAQPDGIHLSLSSASIGLSAHWYAQQGLVGCRGMAVGLHPVVAPILAHSVEHACRHYREHSFPHISDSGSADISASSISLNLMLGV